MSRKKTKRYETENEAKNQDQIFIWRHKSKFRYKHRRAYGKLVYLNGLSLFTSVNRVLFVAVVNVVAIEKTLTLKWLVCVLCVLSLCCRLLGWRMRIRLKSSNRAIFCNVIFAIHTLFSRFSNDKRHIRSISLANHFIYEIYVFQYCRWY